MAEFKIPDIINPPVRSVRGREKVWAVVNSFGGARALAKAMGVNERSVYNFITYEHIPEWRWKIIYAIAKGNGIELDSIFKRSAVGGQGDGTNNAAA